MSTYTIELGKLCQLLGRDTVENCFKDYNLSDYLTQNQIDIINKCGVWNKDTLAKKIVEHFYNREIGLETHNLFFLHAKNLMREIMYKYSHIIYSNSLEFEPLVNVDFTETFERKIDGNSSGSSNSEGSNNSTGININSDTPQGNINKNEILDGKYATSSNTNDISSIANSTLSSSNNSNQTETYTRNQKGNSGSLTTAQALIKQYRDIIYDVDLNIINDLSILFMSIY